MVEDRFATVDIDASKLPPNAQWADGLSVKLPAALGRLLAPDGGIDFEQMRDAARNAASDVRLHAAFTDKPPTSAQLPFSYQQVPAPVRHILALGIGGMQRFRAGTWSKFPGWPIDLSADLAADIVGNSGITFDRTPVLLTHDIDSAEGLENLVHLFLPLEEAVPARSASYVVPCAWPLDDGLVSEVLRRGHEVGIHGYNHDNRTAFVDHAERQRRLAAGRAVGDRYHASGYRAPSLLRTPALLDDLAAFYRYDFEHSHVRRTISGSEQWLRFGATVEVWQDLGNSAVLATGWKPSLSLAQSQENQRIVVQHCRDDLQVGRARLHTYSL